MREQNPRVQRRRGEALCANVPSETTLQFQFQTQREAETEGKEEKHVRPADLLPLQPLQSGALPHEEGEDYADRARTRLVFI